MTKKKPVKPTAHHQPAKGQQPEGAALTQRQVVRAIRILMIDKDLRPADLARILGVTSSYVGHLLSGRRIINVNTLHDIAEATNTVVDVQFTPKVIA
jgi:transcriptional regulator with XRE-family HTH domain